MQMRLTVNNILFVKEGTMDDLTYAWYVAMKSHRVSDLRIYRRFDKDGCLVIDAYPKECLPASVQKFINASSRTLFFEREEPAGFTGGHYVEYIYR